MAVVQRMSEIEYAAFVLSTPEGTWELHDGLLVKKPALGGDRGRIVSGLARQLLPQLDRADYALRIDDARVRGPAHTILVPDLVVVPSAAITAWGDRPGLVIIANPMPLVIEVWTPRTDGYDVDAKIPIYRARGDLEIWRFHPAQRTLTTWVRQADGTYAETIYQPGSALPTALRGATMNRSRQYDA
jgi:Uma2 family endonuclease